MNPILQKNKSNIIFLILIVFVYVLLSIISINNCYFWDNIQQISNEAHWFYLNDYKTMLMPDIAGAEITATGYHPPLMGIMTAALWKVLGYKLWVSHAFILMWAIVLIFNLWKLIRILFSENYAGWVMLIVLIEPTLLTQFAIGSPDFILFTAFVICLRGILERKMLVLSVGIFFLCCINMRGIFAGAILFFVHCYYSYLQKNDNQNLRLFFKTLLPYLPTFILLSVYFVYYFTEKGWFFSGSQDTAHYSIPNESGKIIRHIAEFGLRSIENGRILIWLTGIYIAFLTYKSKVKLTLHEKVLLSFFLLLTGLYVLFIFITQMPLSARYFMPQFFLLTILTLLGIFKFYNKHKINFFLILIICFELTGNLWIYPEKIAKSWDCTLAHLPYYELRKECFNYIDGEKLDYNDISGGFCIHGKRDFIELNKVNKTVGSDNNKKYFIYSNISNVVDSMSDALHNTKNWTPIKRFEKWPVFITIYKNTMNQGNEKP